MACIVKQKEAAREMRVQTETTHGKGSKPKSGFLLGKAFPRHFNGPGEYGGRKRMREEKARLVLPGRE
jgi:hypothetical protein